MRRNLITQALAKSGYLGTITSATATNGTAVDRTGADDLLVVVQTGTITGTVTLDIKVQTDADSGFSNPTDITGAAFTQLDQDDDGVIRVGRVGLRGAEQYVRVVITSAGSTISAPVAVVMLLGDLQRSNADGQGYTAAEHDFSVEA